MTLATRKPYIGPSESQAIANARATDRQYLPEHWRSRDRRRQEPPTNVDALVAWFREQWDLEWPDRLHGHGVWVDSVTGKERADGVEPQGGSALGAPRWSGAMRQWLESSVYARDNEDDLIRPFGASMAALRHEDRWTHDAVMAVAWSFFDWRALIDRDFYTRHGPNDEPMLVMRMPEGPLEKVLRAGLTRLWWLLAEREPHIQAVDT